MTISVRKLCFFKYVLFMNRTFPTHYINTGLWFRGIMSALHAEGPGFDSLRVHLFCNFFRVDLR